MFILCIIMDVKYGKIFLIQNSYKKEPEKS